MGQSAKLDHPVFGVFFIAFGIAVVAYSFVTVLVDFALILLKKMKDGYKLPVLN